MGEFNLKEKIFLGVMILMCVLLGVQIYMSFKIQKEIYDLDTIGWQHEILDENKESNSKLDKINSTLDKIYYYMD